MDGGLHKVEGLAPRDVQSGQVHLLVVVDDDPDKPSSEIGLRAVLY